MLSVFPGRFQLQHRLCVSLRSLPARVNTAGAALFAASQASKTNILKQTLDFKDRLYLIN
jgi:hypothetical protein